MENSWKTLIIPLSPKIREHLHLPAILLMTAIDIIISSSRKYDPISTGLRPRRSRQALNTLRGLKAASKYILVNISLEMLPAIIISYVIYLPVY